ncbi:MAG: sugar phosphate isomerase/epimerase [Planctomycetes bacterium]|nr:sugar phosphate isomerase/epimerase [Planctomycetota bacterium]
MKIGVIVESFRAGLHEGLRKAAEIGAEGVQIYATKGELTPELSPARRDEFVKELGSLGLALSALCGDFGGHGFQVAEDNAGRVEASKGILDLAVDLGTDVVTTHIGAVPSDKSKPKLEAMKAACNELAEYGDRVGASFAVETGPERAKELKEFLDSLSARGVKVNYDPANLVMVTHDDPVAGVGILGDYIVHTHAKDGVHKQDIDAELVYDSFADGNQMGLDYGQYFEEVPLGEGEVDWPAYIQALKDTGFDGFLTIEREVGEDPEADLAKAVKFLRSLGV